MTNEVRKAKIEWQKQMATIINHIIESYPTQEACLKCDIDDEMFETSCQFVDIKHELLNLKDTLENQAKYMEIIMNASQK